MAGSPEAISGGQLNSDFRAPQPISVISSEQQSFHSELLFLPHPLDNLQARDRILKNGADATAVAKVFDDEGRWVLRGKEGEYPTLWQSAPVLVERAIVNELRPIYEIVDNALLGEKIPHGYNLHGLNHVIEVADTSQHLLDEAGYQKDVDIKRINAIASIGHDTGNVLDRRSHATLSPEIVATVMPDVVKDQRAWSMADEAMRLHDEKALLPYIESFGNLKPEEVIQQLRALNNPVLLSLVIADKAGSIGRQRTNPWARTSDTINEDVHMWTNYLARGKGLEMSRDKRDMRAIIEFNPTITDDEYAEFVDIAVERSHHDGYRAMVPEVINQIHREHRVPQFLAWGGNLMGIYRDRFVLSALSAKALNPRLEKFTIELRDNRGVRSRGGGKLTEEIHFDGRLQEQFEALEMVYNSPKDRRPEDYTQATMVFDATEKGN